MDRQAALSQFPGFGEDMVVRSADGEKLGAVIYCGEEQFIVEKGLFFPKDFTFSYDDIQELRDGELIVTHRVESLNSWRDETFPGWKSLAIGTGTGMFAGGAFGTTPEVVGQPDEALAPGETLDDGMPERWSDSSTQASPGYIAGSELPQADLLMAHDRERRESIEAQRDAMGVILPPNRPPIRNPSKKAG